MIAGDIITKARSRLLDEDSIGWPQEEMLGYVSSAQKAVASITDKPFIRNRIKSLDEGSRQIVGHDERKIISIIANATNDGDIGAPVRLVDGASLMAFLPSFHAQELADSVDECFFLDDAQREIYVSPPVNAGVRVVATVHMIPQELQDEDDELQCDDGYEQAIIEHVIYQAYAKESDSPASNAKAAAAFAAFAQYLGVESK